MSQILRVTLLVLFVSAAASLPSPAQATSTPAITLPSITKLPIGPAASKRVCSVAKPGERQCTALRLTQRPAEMAVASGTVTPQFAPSGYGPADLQSAYNLTALSASNGAGMTIAIVDAQDDPTAASDLAEYRSTFGLPACTTASGCFKKVNQFGNASPLPTADAGWAGEISVDIQMVSAICPKCNILLVEAQSPNNSDLNTAVGTAAQMGAIAISNSYGGSESSTDPNDCNGAYNHPGIAVVAASGDDGYEVEFPASCGLVTAAGGTSLTPSSSARGWTESVWSTSLSEGAGSGCSSQEVKPAWQTDTGCTKRTVADISAVADPATGVAVLDTTGSGGWTVFGGTSVASPLIGSIYGLANPPGDVDVPAKYAYDNPSAFYDVTSGQTATCGSYLCEAKVGYDGPTGVGTPNGIGGFGPPAETATSTSISSTLNPSTYGQAVSFTATVNATQTPTGTVQFYIDAVAFGSPVTLSNGSATSVSTSSLTVTTHSVTASYTPDTTSLAASSKSLTQTVSQATPTITWVTPSPITYGTALSGTQLDATSATAGSFAYSPAAGTVLGTGLQTLHVTFTPTDTTDYASATAAVNLTVNQATPTITWAAPAPITYGTALSATQLNATSATAGSFVYSPTAGTVLGAGLQTLHVTFTPTDTTDYATATASVNLTVNQATPTITWAAPAPITYGTALSATQLDATSATAGSFVYSPAAGTVLGAGLQTLHVTFTPTDTTDYATAAGSVSITVNKGVPTITWAALVPITYGTALSGTQLDATSSVSGSLVYSPAAGTVLGAGPQTLHVAFTPTDTTDYATAAGSVSLTINQAVPTIAWAAPTTITYGAALSGAQLDATSSVPGSFVYSPAAGTVLGAGPQTLHVTFTPTDTTDDTSVTASVNLTVNPGTPTVTWPTPASIFYGTALSGAQLNATSAVAGTFAYTPAAGTVPGAGLQTLHVTFTPTDKTDYATSTGSVNLTVNQATPAITWASPASIVYGTALSGAQLNASSSVAGSFTYMPSAGAVLAAGMQTLSTTLTPTDTVDYKPAAAAVSLIVSKAGTTTSLAVTTVQTITGTTATIVATVKPQITGTPTGTVTYLVGTTTLGSGPVGSPFTTGVLPVGTDTLKAVYSGDNNFLTSSGTASATGVAPTPVQLSLPLKTVIYPLPEIYTVQITLQKSKTLSGTLTIYDGAKAISSVSVPPTGLLVGIPVPPLAVGTHPLTAVYSGNLQYPPGQSATVTLTVIKP